MTTPRRQTHPRLAPDIIRIIEALARRAALRDHEAEIRDQGEPANHDRRRDLRPFFQRPPARPLD